MNEVQPVAGDQLRLNAKELADRINAIAETRGISLRELSRRSRLGDSQVGSIVARARKNPNYGPDINTLRAIAFGGEASLDWLVSGQGSMDLTPEERAARAQISEHEAVGMTMEELMRAAPEDIAAISAPHFYVAKAVVRLVWGEKKAAQLEDDLRTAVATRNRK